MGTYRKNKKHKKSRRAGDNQRGKVCQGKCGERLTFKSFNKNPSQPDGLDSYCRDCKASYRRDRKEVIIKSNERYAIQQGKPTRAGTYRQKRGWERRLREFRVTGHITPHGRGAALEKRRKIRLVCGQLRIVGK